MKKTLIKSAVVGVLLLGSSGLAHATLFTDTKTPFDRFDWQNGFTYTHATPLDFSVPPDSVNTATIKLSGIWTNDQTQDIQAVTGTASGTLSANTFTSGWAWNEPSLFTSFDISSIFFPGAGTDILVTLNDLQAPTDGWSLKLTQSVFTLDYNNGASIPSPVPEPASMILLATGLLGCAGLRKKEKK